MQSHHEIINSHFAVGSAPSACPIRGSLPSARTAPLRSCHVTLLEPSLSNHPLTTSPSIVSSHLPYP